MPNAIKQEPTSAGSPEMVPKEEFNRLKRKLEQTEPELRDCKRRLMEAEAKIEKDQKQLKTLKAVMATDVQFRPRRETIRLNLPDFAKAVNVNQNGNKLYSLFSKPIEIAGFQWKLRAYRKANDAWLALFLYAYAPQDYEGPFEFEVDHSLRLLNTFSSKDIHKEAHDTISRVEGKRFGGRGFPCFAKIENLLNPKSGFIRGDGSVQVEADFTVKAATLDHFLVDPSDTAGNHAGSSTD